MMFQIGDSPQHSSIRDEDSLNGYLEELTVFGDFDLDDPDFAPLPNSRSELLSHSGIFNSEFIVFCTS
jgi:hypothetical protein